MALIMERNATITVCGLPLEYVEEMFTPSFAEMTTDELVFAYAEAEEEGDTLLMIEIDLEMQHRRG